MNFEKIISKDEKVLWKGAPNRGLLFRWSDFFYIPVGLLFFAFPLWQCLTFSYIDLRQWSVTIGMFMFFTFGFYFTCFKFFIDALVRKKTIYALTCKRAIVYSGLLFKRVNSVELKNLAHISYLEFPDGSGDIVFGSTTQFNTVIEFRNRRLTSFNWIPNVKDVYFKIQSIQ